MANDTLSIPDNATTSTVAQNPVTAIDIVLEPDATMMEHGKVANAGLLKNFQMASRWVMNTRRTCRCWEAM